MSNEKLSNEAQSPPLRKGDVMRRFCSECEKPNVYCKGMCQACYSKMQRNTDKGKERMKEYNLSAGFQELDPRQLFLIGVRLNRRVSFNINPETTGFVGA